MDMLDTLPTVGEFIKQHDLNAKKSLGQNFLLDLNLTRKIARQSAPLNTGTVIEIGPGPGGLTRALLAEGAENLIAIEKDPRCATALSQVVDASNGRLTVIQGDATGTNLPTLCQQHNAPAPYQIVANLPYNVGTLLLIDWLHHAQNYAQLTLMFQREVAERITATVGDKAYGRLSILCNFICNTHIAMHVPASAFTPPPKVDSAIVTLTPREKPPYPANLATLEKITHHAFGQRRKMLRQSLKGLGVNTTELLATAQIPETQRAENIDLAGYCQIANALDNMEK